MLSRNQIAPRMKPLRWSAAILITAAIALAGCHKPAETEVEAPTPEPHHFAPAGVLYITQMVSVSSDTGIRGIPPGTRVTLVGPAPGGFKVNDGVGEFFVSEQQATNDLELAAAVQSHDVETQRRIAAQKMQKHKSASAAALDAEEKQLTAQIAEARAAQNPDRAAGNTRQSYSTTLLISRLPAMEKRLEEIRRLKGQAR